MFNRYIYTFEADKMTKFASWHRTRCVILVPSIHNLFKLVKCDTSKSDIFVFSIANTCNLSKNDVSKCYINDLLNPNSTKLIKCLVSSV